MGSGSSSSGSESSPTEGSSVVGQESCMSFMSKAGLSETFADMLCGLRVFRHLSQVMGAAHPATGGA